MDWHPTVNPFLKFDETTFDYNWPSCYQTRVLRCHAPDIEYGLGEKGNEVGRIALENNDRIEEWLESEIFKEDLIQPLPAGRDRSGYHIILCGMPDPIKRPGWDEIPTSLFSLPLPALAWKRITECFYLHDQIRKAIQRSNTSPSSTYLVQRVGEEIVEMYTAATSRTWPNNLAITATHFRKSKLTVAIIFGCTDWQMSMAEKLLKRSPEVKGHPLLSVGLFAELTLERETAIVRQSVAECNMAIEKLGLEEETKPEVYRSFELSRELRNCRLRTKKAEEGLRLTQGQLRKMMQQVEEWVNRTRGSAEGQTFGWLGDEFTTSTLRYKERFEDINMELEALMAKCRMIFDDMTYSEELYSSELLGRDAESARHQAKANTVIAFVAMLYLPITTVATVFAMPIFDFSNDWRDLRFRKTGSEADEPTSGSKSQATRSQPVLSSYFWIYLVVSVSLTVITVIGWWRYTRTIKHSRKSKRQVIVYTTNNKSGMGGDQFFLEPEDKGRRS